MEVSDLRIALFSGNYNMTVDGANKALNRLVGYLLAHGAAVRVYSPTVANPDFEPTGDLVSVPSFAIPGRSEYRIPVTFSSRVRQDISAFAPNVVHISSPDRVSRQAAAWARRRRLPVACSVHTRFETYFRYYNLSFLEPVVVAWLRKLYRKCDALIAPSESFAQVLRDQRMNYDIGIWTRGVEQGIFNPGRRDMDWRRSLGIEDHVPAIAFLGRLVMEKGLDVFADAIDVLARRGVPHRVVVIGEGPAGEWFESRLPNASFVGFQGGEDLAHALASCDIFFNPSVTETFGNVGSRSSPRAPPAAPASSSMARPAISSRPARSPALPIISSAIAATSRCAPTMVRRRCSKAAPINGTRSTRRSPTPICA